METSNENEYFIIPNPIYDVVFRYLMEDLESAKIILSTFINEKIIRIQLEPTGKSEKKDKDTKLQIQDPKTSDDIRLFHLDFVATIELPNGNEELIMIELQKASEPDDIFRFKRYISKNFQKKQEKEIIDPKTQSVVPISIPIRLVPIFILNFRIENEIDDLLIQTSRTKVGIFKNKKLEKHNEFIDNLSYDLWIVQLPNLGKIAEEDYKDDEYKSKLYVLLKLFDQKSKVRNNEHRLRLIRKLFPGFLDRVIKRLQSADIENPNLEEQMYAEDEYLRALVERDNKLGIMEQMLEKKDKVIEENKKTIEEKDKTIEEKDKTIEENRKVIEEKDKAIEENRKAIEENRKLIIRFAKMLKDSGVSMEEIQKQTGLSVSDLTDLFNN